MFWANERAVSPKVQVFAGVKRALEEACAPIGVLEALEGGRPSRPLPHFCALRKGHGAFRWPNKKKAGLSGRENIRTDSADKPNERPN
jgi:hypothetical protein